MHAVHQVHAAGPDLHVVQLPKPHGHMDAYLATPRAAAWKSAVIVLDDGPGITPRITTFCDALAREGHAAAAADVLSLRAGEAGLMSAWTQGVDATLEFLREKAPRPPPRFAIVGFGIGGFAALMAGYRCQLGAAVSFYGEGVMRLCSDLGNLDRPRPHAAAMLCFLGTDDKTVSAADVAIARERLAGLRIPHSFVVYPRTRGNFFFPDGAEYRPEAAADAWGRLLHALDTAPRLRFRFRKK
jgi:carboxymethylenebutenolidase